MVPPKRMPQIPPPNATFAAKILKWILDSERKWNEWKARPQPKPPFDGDLASDADIAEARLYANQLIAAGVTPA